MIESKPARPVRSDGVSAAPVVRDGSAAIERRRPAGIEERLPRLRRQIDVKAPKHPNEATPSARRRDGPRPDGHRPRGDHGRGGYRHHHYYGCGHYGFGYDPFYYGFGFHSPFWGIGYNQSDYGGYYYAPEIHVSVDGGGGGEREAAMGALDLDIRPDKAEVFIDGNYVGVADQFDGFPTYLWLEEGTYEVAFYEEGYETIFREYTIYPGVIIDVDDTMRRGESILPTGPPTGFPSEAGSMGVSGLDGDLGRIAVVATPADAAVYLDGHFVGTAAEISELEAGLIVEPGDHVVEIIRPGYSTKSVPISVPAGERADVQLDLEPR